MEGNRKLSGPQRTIWDALSMQDGEIVLKLLTGWHGLRLLDSEFLAYLSGEGYIKAKDNCEADTYICGTCLRCGRCSRQNVMETAMNADSFDDFCDQFPKCRGCPLAAMENYPCKEEHWLKWKEKHHTN